MIAKEEREMHSLKVSFMIKVTRKPNGVLDLYELFKNIPSYYSSAEAILLCQVHKTLENKLSNNYGNFFDKNAGLLLVQNMALATFITLFLYYITTRQISNAVNAYNCILYHNIQIYENNL